MPVGSDLGMGVEFTLKDSFTTPANRIKNSFDSLESKVKGSSGRINNSLKNAGAGFGSFLAAGSIGIGFDSLIKKSAEMSDLLADVSKTTGIAGRALNELKLNIEKIDTRTSVKDLLNIAKAGGQIGIAQKDIFKFTGAIDKMFVALGDQFASPEVLARQINSLRINFSEFGKLPTEEALLKIGNAINFLGSNANTTEGIITNMAKRMSGLGPELGLTAGQIFGISTALGEAGVSAELAGNNLPLVLQKMTQNAGKFAKFTGLSVNEFEKLMDKDILGGLDLVVKGLRQAGPTVTSFQKVLKEAGITGARASEVFLKLARNQAGLKTRIDQATLALTNQDSILAEFNIKNDNFAAKLDKLDKKIGIFLGKLGNITAVFIAPVIDGLAIVIDKINSFVDTPIGGFLSSAGLGIAAVLGGMAALAGGIIAVKTALAGATALAAGFGIALGPVTLVVGVLAGTVFLAHKSLSDFDRFLIDFNQNKDAQFSWITKVGGFAKGVIEIFKTWNGETFQISKNMRDALEKMGILEHFKTFSTVIVRGIEFTKAYGSEFIKMATSTFEAFKPLVSAVSDLFTTIAGFFGFERLTSSTESWAKAGRIFGKIISTVVLGPLKLLVNTLTLGVKMLNLFASAFKSVITVAKSVPKLVRSFFDDDVDTSKVNKDIFGSITNVGSAAIGVKDTVKDVFGFGEEEQGIEKQISETNTRVQIEKSRAENKFLLDDKLLDIINQKQGPLQPNVNINVKIGEEEIKDKVIEMINEEKARQ